MAESPVEQRARILETTGVLPDEYDLAVKLGYQPESWDGMYRLPADRPFEAIGRSVIIRELNTRVINGRMPKYEHIYRRDGQGLNFRARMVPLPR